MTLGEKIDLCVSIRQVQIFSRLLAYGKQVKPENINLEVISKLTLKVIGLDEITKAVNTDRRQRIKV